MFAVHISVLKELVAALRTIEVGSKTVSTPSVTIPSLLSVCWFKLPKVHVVEESTAPLNRHLKHVCTPPSTIIRVSNVELAVMLKHPCELPVGGKGLQNDVLKTTKLKYIHPTYHSNSRHTYYVCVELEAGEKLISQKIYDQPYLLLHHKPMESAVVSI